MAAPERLQKFLANAGIASRRKAEELILAGRVTVNGVPITLLGTRIDPDRDTVTVDDRVVLAGPITWIALHKPAGFLTSRGDPHGRPTIYDLLPPTYRGLFYVGRLDFDTEGLVLLTNDGTVAHRLQHPRFGVLREYEATVQGVPDPGTLKTLLSGVQLSDGPARFVSARIVRQGARRSTLQVALAEGRKREVRRLFEAVGYPVLRLKRIRFGPVALDSLPAGSWRPLSDAEIAALND